MELGDEHAIALSLKLLSLHEWGPRLQLTVENRSAEKLLLPQLFIHDLHIGQIASFEEAEWQSQWLNNSLAGGEILLLPGESQEIEWRARAEAWVEQNDPLDPNTMDREVTDSSGLTWRENHRQYTINLVPGDCLVWYELHVDESYFNPESHVRIHHLREFAAEQEALVWVGRVRSNRIHFTYG